MDKTQTSYELLAGLDVSKHVEKKGNLSYLSWAWAVDQLLRHDVDANWAHHDPRVMPDNTMMVFCTVTAFGRARTMQLPVMDYKNKAIANPDAFAINTAMMRCLVKAIALHGLGLYIYAGEDLPLDATTGSDKPEKLASFKTVAQNDFEDSSPAEQERLRGHADVITSLCISGDLEAATARLQLACEGNEPVKVALSWLVSKEHQKLIKAYRVEKSKAHMIATVKAEAIGGQPDF